MWREPEGERRRRIGEEKIENWKKRPWIKERKNKSEWRIEERLEEEIWEVDNQEEETPKRKAIGEILWVI